MYMYVYVRVYVSPYCIYCIVLINNVCIVMYCNVYECNVMS